MARDVKFVLAQVEAGKTIRFLRDYYGRQKVEVRTAWVWRVRVALSDHEIMVVRDALYARRRSRVLRPAMA